MARLGDLLALSYNGLVQSWPEIVRLASQRRDTQTTFLEDSEE